MTGSFECFFHVVHLVLLVVWAVCMYKDNYDGMSKSLVGISARVMGIGLCTTIDLGRMMIVQPPYLGSYFQRQIMHREKTLIVCQMEIYQLGVQAEAAAAQQAPAAEASPQTAPDEASSLQRSNATTSDGTVVAVEGAYQAPSGTMMLLVVPVQPPEAEDQQQHSAQSMQPLTAGAKQRPKPAASEATDASSSAGTRV
ncbi:uncharacterized protein [Dermacentor albipictus]|uniref:uncharacterized protein isoform X2 n=1 Tax=Dermacentor albipictus TaxID=60249 RepID=UPI0038FCAC9D